MQSEDGARSESASSDDSLEHADVMDCSEVSCFSPEQELEGDNVDFCMHTDRGIDETSHENDHELEGVGTGAEDTGDDEPIGDWDQFDPELLS